MLSVAVRSKKYTRTFPLSRSDAYREMAATYAGLYPICGGHGKPGGWTVVHLPLTRGRDATHWRKDGDVRISGGLARGINLTVPKGDAVRPATDGMRQAVFSSLGERVGGAGVLDLFAGSGAYGLEALSRGAATATFVEKNPKALLCLRQNIAAVCKSTGQSPAVASVLPLDVLKAPMAGAVAPDLVFVDPPYEIIREVSDPLFARLTEALASKPDALVVFEMPGEIELSPPGWTCLKRIGKGNRQPTVAIFRRSETP